jgi:excisionase family DNA binding protein
MQLKEKELVDVSEASEYTRLARQTLYDYVHKGKIPHLKIGRKLVFRVTELDKWINYGGDYDAAKRVKNERQR